MSGAVRVLIVEDSPVVQQLLAYAISSDPRLEVVGVAGDGDEAMRQLARLRPDVVSMDIRLPGQNGLELTRRIMHEQPVPIVVVASDVEDTTLNISMRALKAGALAVVEKPGSMVRADWQALSRHLCTQLLIMSKVKVVKQRAPRNEPAPRTSPLSGGMPRLVGIAASTGGPGALSKVLGALPADYPVPITVVQHMGAQFMAGFVGWLASTVRIRVRLAEEGETLEPGTVLVAPGHRHLAVTGDAVRLVCAPPVHGQLPSADRMFSSMAEHLGARAVGVLLTGMGEDGARGLLELRRSGALTIAEHSDTAVIWGMPGAAVGLGAAAEVLPLDHIGPRLRSLAEASPGLEVS